MRKRAVQGHRSPILYTRRPAPLILLCLAVLLAASLAGCKKFSLIEELGQEGEGGNLELSPESARVVKGGSILFVARGGDKPYRFDVVGGVGSINPDTGVYTAPSASGLTETVRLTDNSGAVRTATVDVTGAAVALTVSPVSVTVPPGGSVTFVASGGAPTAPYQFRVQTPYGTGSPSVGSISGVYVAGSNPGTDTIEVSQDGGSIWSPLASVTVAVATSNVDYQIVNVDTVTMAAGGRAGQPLSLPSAFQIENIDGAAGSRTIYWYVHLSEDGVAGPGDYLVAQGIQGPLASGAFSSPIDITGKWADFVDPAASFIIRIFAADDNNGANDEGVYGTAVAAADVDYSVPTVTHTGGTAPGSTFTAEFTIENTGSDGGSKTVYWYARSSTDSVYDAADRLVDSGTLSGLSPAVPGTVPFGGTWLNAGNRYLVVHAQAGDDTDGGAAAGNNINATPAPIAVTAPDVDYSIPAVNLPSTDIVGTSFGGSFEAYNGGTADGTASVEWACYLSFDTTLDASDEIFDSGSIAPIDAGNSIYPVYDGTWTTPGNYYVICSVDADDDISAANNDSASALVPVTDVQSDYAVVTVLHDSGTTAGGTVQGQFDTNNLGPDDGVSDVNWKVYSSSDAVWDGGDSIIDSGWIAPQTVAAADVNQSFSGYWPSGAGSRYLVVVITTPEDANGANNEGATAAPVVVSGPDVDNRIVAPAPVVTGGSFRAGDAMSGEFSLRNAGSDAGDADVSWNVYASPDVVLDAGDTVLASGTKSPLSAGATQVVPFTGVWPNTEGNYYLIVEISSTDPVGVATMASAAPSAIAPRDVNYTVTTAEVIFADMDAWDSFPGRFKYQNLGSADAVQSVYWEAYASADAVIGPGDTLINSGVEPALDAGVESAFVTIGGKAPLRFGTYRLIVRLSNGEDQIPGDNDVVSPTPFTVGINDEAANEPNDDWGGLTDAYQTAQIMHPGIEILVTGTMDALGGDTDDVIRFHTGTATAITFTWVLTGGIIADQDMFVLDDLANVVGQETLTVTGSSISLVWPVDASDFRYIHLWTLDALDLGTYELRIKAE